MDLVAKSREILEALTTFPYYVILPPTKGHASWQEASALAFALECIGASDNKLPSRLGATRVTVNPKASSVEDAVTRYSRTTIALEPHTDSSQHEEPHSIVIFGMSRPDEVGGQTQMVVIDELIPLLDSETVHLLHESIWPLGQQPKPILTGKHDTDGTRISYYRAQLERTLELGVSLCESQKRALSNLDGAINALAEQRSFRLEKGETLLINNHKVLHGRTALADGSERLLIRYRLRVNLTACIGALNAEKPLSNSITERLMYGASLLEEQGRQTQAQILRGDAELFGSSVVPDNSQSFPPRPIKRVPSMSDVRYALGEQQFDKAHSLLQQLVEAKGHNFDVSYFLSALESQRGEHQKAADLLVKAANCRPFIKVCHDSVKPVVLKVRSFEGTKVKFRFGTSNTFNTRLVGGQLSTKHWICRERFHVTLGNAASLAFGAKTPPPFDVLFNAVSDVDASPNALIGLETFIESHNIERIINCPEGLRRTARNLISVRANSLPQLRAGRTQRYSGMALLDIPLLAMKIQEDLSFPILVRSVGTHTGSTLSKCDDGQRLQEALAGLSKMRDLYVSEFIDVSCEKGVFHKIRAFYIDGALYPIHLLRSEHWEVGRRGDRLKIMREQKWMQADEAHCLSDLRDYLGAANHAALLGFMADIGLDFCGVDFALDRTGKIVIFEANPAMRHHYDHVITAPYIKPAHDRATAAFNQMIASRSNPN